MVKRKDVSNRILVGITGCKERHWKSKLKDINKFKIPKVALFLERFDKSERDKIYTALLGSKIKEIPLVHLRNDMGKEELAFLKKNFKSSYFTIHEDTFKYLKKWRDFYKNIFLEMNSDGYVSKSVKVGKIGGFCVDISHFKVEEEKWSQEFEYILKREKKPIFACNHLNGYSYQKNVDLHTIRSLRNFDYLKTIPKFLFGDVIAMEMENNIPQQLKFKKHLINMLNMLFNK